MKHTLLVLCVLAFASVAGEATPEFHVGPLPVVETWEDFALHTCIEFGVEPDMVFRLIYEESRNNPLAVGTNRNGSHDYGLMQLNEKTVRQLHIEHPLDYRQNLIGGIGLLAYYQELYHGDKHMALCAYARGPGNCITRHHEALTP